MQEEMSIKNAIKFLSLNYQVRRILGIPFRSYNVKR